VRCKRNPGTEPLVFDGISTKPILLCKKCMTAFTETYYGWRDRTWELSPGFCSILDCRLPSILSVQYTRPVISSEEQDALCIEHFKEIYAKWQEWIAQK